VAVNEAAPVSRLERSVPRLGARARGLLASEWTKVRSVRSTFWSFVVAAVTALGGSAIIAVASASAKGRSGLPLDPVASVFFAWLEYPVLAVGVVGVLTFTSECSTGQIRTTFSAVPQRVAVLVAKAAVVGAVVLALGEVLAFASFLLSQAILAGHHSQLSLSRAGELRAVMAAGFSLFVVAMVGLGLGAIVRHTAGALAALPAVIYLPLLVLSLPSPWADRIGSYTILMSAYQLVSVHRHAGLLSPALSLVVLVAWAAALLVAGAVAITRRDA
jgi:ABC-2 type transport system permease protein